MLVVTPRIGETIDRIENSAQLSEEKRSYVFDLIDMCLRDFKAKKAYAL
jgi:hypothetical protein